jgi:hypothetical protein
VGPRAGLVTVLKRKVPSPYWDSNPDHLIIQPIVAIPTELSWLLHRAGRYISSSLEMFATHINIKVDIGMDKR